MRNGLSGQPNTLVAQVARRCLSRRAAELLIGLTLKQRGAARKQGLQISLADLEYILVEKTLQIKDFGRKAVWGKGMVVATGFLETSLVVRLLEII